MSNEVEAYCPDCQEELTRDDYNYDNGCEACGCEDLFLGPDAFLDFADARMDIDVSSLR